MMKIKLAGILGMISLLVATMATSGTAWAFSALSTLKNQPTVSASAPSSGLDTCCWIVILLILIAIALVVTTMVMINKFRKEYRRDREIDASRLAAARSYLAEGEEDKGVKDE